MELSEVLLLGNMVASIFLFFLILYTLGKVKLLELVVQKIKDPEKVFNMMMKNKIPIIMGPQGPIMPMDVQQKQGKNPLTG